MKYLFVLAVLLAVPLSAQDSGQSFADVELVRVYDGDTIYVDIASLPALFGDDIGIRLARIDTPEIRGKCPEEKRLAYQARDYVIVLLQKANSIRLEQAQRGKYFRIVAEVIADGVNVSDKLLEEGYAVGYDGGKKQGWCSPR